MTQEERHLAVNCSQRWIGPGLVFVNADRILHRGVRDETASTF